MKKKKNIRPYKRKTVIKRTRSSMTVKRKQKRKENKFLQSATKVLRLLLLFGVSVIIIYQLFKSENKSANQEISTTEEQIQSPNDSLFQPDFMEDDTPDFDTLSTKEKLVYSLNEILKSYKVNESWINRKQSSFQVQLPPELPAEIIIYDIIQKVKKLDLSYINSKENLKRSRSTLTIVSKEDTLFTILFKNNKTIQRQAGKIAIIIDDFGYYDNNITEKFLELEYPLTISILPGQKYTKVIAKKARLNGKEIFLHLPMEPKQGKVEQTEFTIKTNMTSEQVSLSIKKALDVLPDAVGVNNHMGSKATENEQLLDALFSELKRMNKMFVDSKTTNNSIAPEMAVKHKIDFLQNAAFLERSKQEDKQHIRNKLKLAAKISEREGTVVIIGHPYLETINVLTEELPNLEKQGFEIVAVTELIEKF